MVVRTINRDKGAKVVGGKHYEFDATALDGRKEVADILENIAITVTREFEGRTLTTSRTQRWEKTDTIEGTLQSYSQKIGDMSSLGHRGFREKVFATANGKLLEIGKRLKIRDVVYTVFNIDREIVAGFSLNYLKEIK